MIKTNMDFMNPDQENLCGSEHISYDNLTPFTCAALAHGAGRNILITYKP